MQNITFNVANTAMLSYDNLHVHFRASSSLSLNYYHYMIAYIKNQYLSFLFSFREIKCETDSISRKNPIIEVYFDLLCTHFNITFSFYL